MLNLFLCLYFKRSSDLLFKRLFLSAFMIASFSSKHRLQRFAPSMYAGRHSFEDRPIYSEILSLSS